MFWNLQNMYEQKTITPEEIDAEGAEGPKRQRVDKGSIRMYHTRDLDYRETTVAIVMQVDPDILIVVELAVGTRDLKAQGKAIGDGHVAFSHFAPSELLTSLNAWYAAQTGVNVTWDYAVSNVNSSDLVAAAQAAGVQLSGSRNSMFEQYAIFWKNGKFKYASTSGNANANPTIDILTRDKLGQPIAFVQRNPGGMRLTETASGADVYIVMNHSVWGREQDREAAIPKLAGVKQVVDEPRLVFAGDFNVDYTGSQAKYQSLTSLPNLVVRNGANATSRVTSDPASLHNAYDQVFTRGVTPGDVTPADPKGGPFNFATGYFQSDWATACCISDHLPVWATITLP